MTVCSISVCTVPASQFLRKTIASRAPSRAALLSVCHWKKSTPNSRIPNRITRSAGRISTNSTIAMPPRRRARRGEKSAVLRALEPAPEEIAEAALRDDERDREAAADEHHPEEHGEEGFAPEERAQHHGGPHVAGAEPAEGVGNQENPEGDRPAGRGTAEAGRAPGPPRGPRGAPEEGGGGGGGGGGG